MLSTRKPLVRAVLGSILLSILCVNFASPLLAQEEVVAVFFGDSITEAHGASTETERWVNQVASAQGWTEFINAGIGATVLQNTRQHTVPRLGRAALNNGRDTFSRRILSHDPTHIILLYGVNDILLNDPAFTAEHFENDLGEIVARLIDAGVPAAQIVIGSAPYINPDFYTVYPNYDSGSLSEHEAYVTAAAQVAQTYQTRYADVYQAMLTQGGNALLHEDGLHPNDAGNDVITQAILEALGGEE